MALSGLPFATSRSSFPIELIRVINVTNQLINQYFTCQSEEVNIGEIHRILVSGFPSEEVFTENFYVKDFNRLEGFKPLFNLLSKWNEIKSLRTTRFIGMNSFYKLIKYLVNSPFSNSQLIELKFWRAIYDFYWFNPEIEDGITCIRPGLNFKYSEVRSLNGNGCQNLKICQGELGKEGLFDFRYESRFSNYNGIPEYLWNNPIIRPHMIIDPYINKSIVPLMTSDIPFIKSNSDDLIILAGQVSSISDEITSIKDSLKKQINYSKILELVGNLESKLNEKDYSDKEKWLSIEHRLTNLEKTKQHINEPQIPIIDYEKLYLEQVKLNEELRKSIKVIVQTEGDPEPLKVCEKKKVIILKKQ